VAEAIAKAFGPHCEVVLHSLEDLSQSVIKILNGHVTGRTLGSPLTDLGIEVLKKSDIMDSDVVGPYFNKLDDGRQLRCVTCVVRNQAGEPIGMLCLNFDLSAPLLDFFTGLMQVDSEIGEKRPEHFPQTPKGLITRILANVRSEVNQHNKLSPSERNKMIVMELYRRGMFNIRGAVDMVAKESGISRYTVYNYLRESKALDGEE
jgi:predicted transcriptional regulator YheO